MRASKIAVLLNACFSCWASAAVSTYNFEGSSVPSQFVLTGNAGGYSQTLTSTNAFAGTQALSVNLNSTGVNNYAQSTITMPEKYQHVSFSLYDEFAGNSPVYYYVFLGSVSNFSDGLNYLDRGYPGILEMFRQATTTSPVRTVGWHTMDISIGSNSIEYKMDGNFIGNAVISPSTVFDTIAFQIASAGGTGTNSLLIDNLSITAVPEPSSLIFGGLFGIGFCFQRKRK